MNAKTEQTATDRMAALATQIGEGWVIDLLEDINLCCDDSHRQHLNIDWGRKLIDVDNEHESTNAVTMYQYHGHLTALRLPAATTQTAILEALKTHIAQVRTLADAYESKWDGHNHVATFVGVEVGTALLDDLADDLLEEPAATYQHWSAESWYDSATPESCGITADTTDEQIAEIASRDVDQALTESEDYRLGVILDQADVERMMREWRDDLKS